jgi:hypothetical protein
VSDKNQQTAGHDPLPPALPKVTAQPTAEIHTSYKPVTSPPRPVDVEARLADKIAALQSRETPLVSFLRSISQFSTIPITLDPDSIGLIGLSAQTPVSVDQQETTVGDVLRLTLQPKKLVCEIADDHLIVGSRYSVDQRLIQWHPPVSDLVDNPQEMDALIEQIHHVVAPASWQRHGGQGTIEAVSDRLTVTQTPGVHLRIYALCEKLRVARGQPMLGKRRSAQFRLDTRCAQARQLLERPVSIRTLPDTPFRSVVRSFENASGATVLVDWHALAQQGWNGDTQVTVAFDELPLSDALVALLAPMRLSYRAVDEATLQITSESALLARPELEFYAVGDLTSRRNGRGISGQQLSARLTALLDEEDVPGTTGIAYDEKSQCLLVLLPQPKHHAVVELLGQWRRQR